jgi:nicotinate-nucleotide pyrophosphorylase (carboxylating)
MPASPSPDGHTDGAAVLTGAAPWDPAAPAVRAAIAAALAEDAAATDVTTLALVPEDAPGSGSLRVKSRGVVAGLDIAEAVFRAVDPSVRFEALAADGDRVVAGTVAARVHGPLRSLLAGERTAVNFLQRMGGIATLTAAFRDAVAGTRAEILATRKTAPGLRPFDLRAVRLGGGGVHRASLSERVLVKENHLRAARAAGTCASMSDVVSRVLAASGAKAVGIEAADLQELRAALVPGVDLVLLDNLDPATCAQAVAIRNAWAPGGPPLLEASGGIGLGNVRAYAESGVERISVGALTHSVTALDVSLVLAG